MLLPRTLLCLTQAWLVLADTQLVLNQLQTISATTSPLTYTLPSSPNPVSVSVASCSYPRSTPRFFVSNGSVSSPGPDDLGQQDVFEIDISEYSLGNVTVQVTNTAVLAVYNATDMTFEVGVSDQGESSFLPPLYASHSTLSCLQQCWKCACPPSLLSRAVWLLWRSGMRDRQRLAADPLLVFVWSILIMSFSRADTPGSRRSPTFQRQHRKPGAHVLPSNRSPRILCPVVSKLHPASSKHVPAPGTGVSRRVLLVHRCHDIFSIQLLAVHWLCVPRLGEQRWAIPHPIRQQRAVATRFRWLAVAVVRQRPGSEHQLHSICGEGRDPSLTSRIFHHQIWYVCPPA